jgi:hypothetical protein
LEVIEGAELVDGTMEMGIFVGGDFTNQWRIVMIVQAS